MALLSNTVASPSTIAGTLAFGLIARYSGLCCSPLRVSTGTGSYGKPVSSSMSATFIGLGAPRELEQPDDLPIGADVDRVGRRHFRQARHGHDLAADRHHELGAGRQPHLAHVDDVIVGRT